MLDQALRRGLRLRYQLSSVPASGLVPQGNPAEPTQLELTAAKAAVRLLRNQACHVPLTSQKCQTLVVAFLLRGVLVRMSLGRQQQFLAIAILLALGVSIRTLASWVLLAPQRRPPDRDQNRPL